jgi:hypothetical protein
MMNEHDAKCLPSTLKGKQIRTALQFLSEGRFIRKRILFYACLVALIATIFMFFAKIIGFGIGFVACIVLLWLMESRLPKGEVRRIRQLHEKGLLDFALTEFSSSAMLYLSKNICCGNSFLYLRNIGLTIPLCDILWAYGHRKTTAHNGIFRGNTITITESYILHLRDGKKIKIPVDALSGDAINNFIARILKHNQYLLVGFSPFNKAIYKKIISQIPNYHRAKRVLLIKSAVILTIMAIAISWAIGSFYVEDYETVVRDIEFAEYDPSGESGVYSYMDVSTILGWFSIETTRSMSSSAHGNRGAVTVGAPQLTTWYITFDENDIGFIEVSGRDAISHYSDVLAEALDEYKKIPPQRVYGTTVHLPPREELIDDLSTTIVNRMRESIASEEINFSVIRSAIEQEINEIYELLDGRVILQLHDTRTWTERVPYAEYRSEKIIFPGIVFFALMVAFVLIVNNHRKWKKKMGATK